MNKYILAILILFTGGCVSLKDNKSKDDLYRSLIIGAWVYGSEESCWYDDAEFLPNGIKKVTMKFCDKNGQIVTAWYLAKWSILNGHIEENMYEYSENSGFTKEDLNAPEYDKIIFLNERELKVSDARRVSLYKRKP